VKAAGATVGAPLSEVIPLVLAEARRALPPADSSDAPDGPGEDAPAERRSVDRAGSAEAP
jgi:hypothetical protein